MVVVFNIYRFQSIYIRSSLESTLSQEFRFDIEKGCVLLGFGRRMKFFVTAEERP